MRRWLPVVLLGLAVLATALISARPDANRPTVQSRAGGGYRAAFAYLTERGRDVAAWEQPWSELKQPGTLILALPAVRPVTDEEIPYLARWIRSGGHLVFLPSGGTPTSSPLLQFLRVSESRADGTPPEGWEDWKRWTNEQNELHGEGGTLVLAGHDRRTTCPVGSTPLYRTVDDIDAVCTTRVGQGSIAVVNNASVWNNNQLGAGANLALLESMTAAPGPVWFDEWHHGANLTPEESDLGFAPLALLGHGALLYVAYAWSVSRPVGPPLRALAGPSSSMLRELDVLGRLHSAGGHARAAAARLESLAAARFRRRRIENPVPKRRVADEAAFVALAHEIGTLEKEGRDGSHR